MAKVKAEATVTIDSLGKWQQPILDAVKAELHGAKASYTVLPFGRAGLVVYWPGFHGHDVTQRQKIVRDVVRKLSAAADKRISMVLALTPKEVADFRTSDRDFRGGS